MHQLGGSNIDNGLAITTNNVCDVFFTGYYTTNSDFDGVVLSSMGGGNDIFFASLDSSGAIRWATNGGGSANDAGNDIAYDAFGNRVLATGYVGSSVGSTFGSYSFTGAHNGYLVAFSEGACQVKGNVYRDNNNNGINDIGDQLLPNIMVRVTPGPLWTNASYTGLYNLYTGVGNFTLDLPNLPAYYVQTGSVTQSANFTAFGQVDAGNDFGLFATANINDLSITITPMHTRLRDSTTAGFYITYRDVGTTIISGAQVDFTYNPLINFVVSQPAPTTTASGSVSWIVPTLYPGDVGQIVAYLEVPGLTLGSYETFTTLISHPLVEQTPLNNVDSISLLVVNAFDPNLKVVFPVGDVTPAQVSAGMDLDYTIHFQNTGNDTAYFVRLIDTLSMNVDLGSFEWVAESHPSQWHIDGNRVLTVDFNNINLVDSLHNETMSHGFFRFKIAALNTLANGDRITNAADIFFDFNPAVRTNTTVTQVLDPVSVYAPQGETQLRVYPVPAHETVYFSWKTSGNHHAQVELLDAYGRIFGQADLDQNGGSIDLSQLSAGMYIYRVKEKGRILETGKLVVGR